MAQEIIHDKFDNEIYLTDERWEHIVETHEEMVGYRGRIFTTLRTGQSRQDAFDPSKYKYTKRFTDLPEDFTHVVVVVKFTQHEDAQGIERPNNFILTAYQVSRG
ncbi:MAG: hypothetical protein HYZ50_06190 [Deltaproteobacteria bacterium]|nr:hypothetical protein [Deltaproteobacteria bacterium]